jgi:tetratricopeptide (TPR) repeat protein
MKLVKGHTLAALLEARPDPAHDRPRFLTAFEAVCQTMAYAHARGVIHRDLKPGNIMVGSFGEVQVMDWGLAKVLRHGSVIDKETPENERETNVATARSSSETHASQAGSVLGTPEYMPPEQARGEVDAVDERADVFSLGAILCEILTGRPPYHAPTPVEIQRKAASGDLAEALGRLAESGAEPELLALASRCLSSHSKDRPRDAGSVARAMTAYLAGVQERLRGAEMARVEAQARTVEERKRRKTQFRMAAGILIALGAGIAGVAMQWNRAEANLTKSQARLKLANEALERFYTGASEDVLLKEPQLKPLRDRLLGSALEFYKKLQASLEADSGAMPEAELAAAYERVGAITGQIGSAASAIEALEHALAIRRRLAARAPQSADAHDALAEVLERHSGLIAAVGRAPEALEDLQQARAFRQELADLNPVIASNRVKLAQTDGLIAHLLRTRLNRQPEALEAIGRAGETYEALLSERPSDVDALRGLGQVRFTQGGIWFQMGRTAEAFAAAEKAVAIFDDLARQNPKDLVAREMLGNALLDRGGAASFLNRMDSGENAFQSALATFRQMAHDEPNASRYQYDLAKAHNSLGYFYSRAKRFQAAAEESQRSLHVLDRLVEHNPGVREYEAMQGLVMGNLGDALRDLGRLDQSLEIMKRALVVSDRLARENPGAHHYQRAKASSQIVTASLLNQMGRRSESAKAYEDALASYEAVSPKNSGVIFNIACAHACLASLIGEEPGLTPPRRAVAARHLEDAMSALRRAVDTGYRNPKFFTSDPDLAPLRSRPDFQQLVAELVFEGDLFAK